MGNALNRVCCEEGRMKGKGERTQIIMPSAIDLLHFFNRPSLEINSNSVINPSSEMTKLKGNECPNTGDDLMAHYVMPCCYIDGKME